jgi:hypothetical protein
LFVLRRMNKRLRRRKFWNFIRHRNLNNDKTYTLRFYGDIL